MRQSLIEKLHKNIIDKLKTAPAFEKVRVSEYLSLKKNIREGLTAMSERDLLKLYAKALSGNILKTLSAGQAGSSTRISKFLENMLVFEQRNSLSPTLVVAFIQNLFAFSKTSNQQQSPGVETVSIKEAIVHNFDEVLPEQNQSSRQERRTEPDESFFDSDFYRFGSLNKKRLKLDRQEVRFLNKVNIGNNSFTEIPQCADETALFYLRLLRSMDHLYQIHGQNFQEALQKLDDDAYDFFRTAYENTWNIPPSGKVYKALIKIAEQEIRSIYRHKRKLDTSKGRYFLTKNLRPLNDRKLSSMIENAEEHVNPPDEKTIVALNALNVTRWKEEFKTIRANENLSEEAIQHEINLLLKKNIRNKNLSEIYYELAKFWTGKNNTKAVKSYIHHYQLSLDNGFKPPKNLPKTYYGKLLKTKSQKEAFETLVKSLSRFKNPELALIGAAEIFIPKIVRKEIVLDEKSIVQINEHHAETVEKLSEILDENETEQQLPDANITTPDAITENITPENPAPEIPATDVPAGLEDLFGNQEEDSDISDLQLEKYHLELLQDLLENDNRISQDNVGALARKHRVFKGKLINQLNEKFYSIFEDNLIEETPEGYQLIEDYLEEAKSILKNVAKN